MEYKYYWYFSIANIIMGVPGIFLNSLLSFLLWKFKKLNTISFRFIFIQSVSDVVVGITLVSSRTVFFSINDVDFDKIKSFSDIVCDTLCMFSGNTVLLVAIDRFLHMKLLNRYSGIMTKNRAIMLMLVNAAFCFALLIVEIIGYFDGFYQIFVIVSNFIAIFLVATISGIYCHTFKSVEKRTRESSKARSTVFQSGRNPTKQFQKVIILILTAFVLCSAPIVIFALVQFIFEKRKMHNEVITVCFFVSRLLVCLNSTLNASIFLTVNKELRELMFQTCGCSADTADSDERSRDISVFT